MLTEQLSQQQLYIRLTAKLLKLLRSQSTLINLLNLLTPLSTLSNLAETRMDKGLYKDAHVSTLAEHLSQPKTQGTSRLFTLCGTQGREKALATEILRGGHLGVAGGHFGVANGCVGVVCMVSMVVMGGIFHER